MCVPVRSLAPLSCIFIHIISLLELFMSMTFFINIVCCFSWQYQSDLEHSQNSRNHANSRRQSNGNCQVPLSNKPPASNHRPGLRRSLNQKDLKYPDGYSVRLVSIHVEDITAVLSNCQSYN